MRASYRQLRALGFRRWRAFRLVLLGRRLRKHDKPIDYGRETHTEH